MKTKFATTLALASALLFAGATGSLADRAPTEDERISIEQALSAAGFTRWEEIEWDDDGYWEVDDAVTPDGEKFDLKLDENFAIIERDRD